MERAVGLADHASNHPRAAASMTHALSRIIAEPARLRMTAISGATTRNFIGSTVF
jgi:hypothetical protein